MEGGINNVAAEMDLDRPSGDQIPQSQPIDATQVVNLAGGFVWQIDGISRLRRFICLGCEGGTYYASQKELTIENIQSIKKLVSGGRGLDVVREIEQFSLEGRTAKQDNILFVLAYCARQTEDRDTKIAAYEALPKICRIPTHLFAFVGFAEKLSKSGEGKETTGWGRAHRRAIANWYTRYANAPAKLAMHVTKYKNRNGWTHFDLFRLSHVKTDRAELGAIFRYVVKGLGAAKEQFLKEPAAATPALLEIFKFLQAVEDTKTVDAENVDKIVSLIEENHLVREHIPTQFLKSIEVWRVLLRDMPMTALMRNLAKMTSIGLLKPGAEETAQVVLKLSDDDKIKEARIHPFNVLNALLTYRSCKGAKGSLKWQACPEIEQALDDMFYKAFKFVEPTGKRFLLAVDVSGSMTVCNVIGSAAMTSYQAAAAMMMTTLRTESNCEVCAFDTTLTPMKVKPEFKLPETMLAFEGFLCGNTDCAAPMLYALEHKKEVDVFVIYTDNDTWYGDIHPAAALRNYRKEMGIYDAKLIVTAFSASEFSIADPEDPGMLDIAGFDSGAPETMRQFVLGNI
ncbi:RNA-binding protein Ro60-like [Tubulanus polymorphus]|uniref:RNA-binding protein Ro60-like n=1 Tax=Tubulanus polymorphus TaxID=672921 RepID=UPI003DA5AF87